MTENKTRNKISKTRSGMSAGEEILKFLCTTSGPRYKGVETNALGLPVFLFRFFTPSNIYTAVSRLKKKKYVTFHGSNISITKDGEYYYKKRSARMRIFDSPFKEKSPKNLLVFFDVPEKRKAEREWLRRQLRIFDYEMIQQSVWVGPSPLPEEFKLYLKKTKLSPHLKYFKLAKGFKTKK